tara:strand:- start:205 stop:690 length:486 start_codon:yes stop_codon:yes gene_type:complete
MKIKLKKYQRVYSFDYDNTLIDYKYIRDELGDIEDVVYHGPNSGNVNKFKKLKQMGHKVIIVTSRQKRIKKPPWDVSPSPEDFSKKYNLNADGIYYTAGDDKAQTLSRLGVFKHWDDDEEEIKAIMTWNQNNETDIKFELVDVPEDISESLRNKFLRWING